MDGLSISRRVQMEAVDGNDIDDGFDSEGNELQYPGAYYTQWNQHCWDTIENVDRILSDKSHLLVNYDYFHKTCYYVYKTMDPRT